MRSHALTLIGLLAFAAACPSEPPAPLPDAGVDAGPAADGGSPVSALCQEGAGVAVALGPWITTAGEGARVRRAESADLLTGEAARGRAGDWLLENDAVRVIVEGMDRHIGPSPYGGNVLDADLVQSGGGRDAFGEMSLLLNLGRTVRPEEICIVRDGSEGGSAILAVTGPDVLNDYLNLPAVLSRMLGAFGRSWLEPEADLGLLITQYYVLSPGESRLRIVTALRNDSGLRRVVLIGEVMERGGRTDLFVPGRELGSSFGDRQLPDQTQGWLAWVSPEISYGYGVRDDGGAPRPGTVLTIAGVTPILHGVESLFDYLRPTPPALLPPGSITLAPDAVHVFTRELTLGRDLGGVVAEREAAAGAGLGELKGTVRYPDGAVPPAGTRVAVLGPLGRTFSVVSVEAGSFTTRLPAGTFQLLVDAPGSAFPSPQSVEVPSGGSVQADLVAPRSGLLVARVRTPAGEPTPAKVTLICRTTCPRSGSQAGLFRDVGADALPGDVQHVGFVGPAGEESFRVPPGFYDVVVSRGSEWSTSPSGWPRETRPFVIPDGPVLLEAQIAQVIDTTGWMSADLHVHALGSPDSLITNRQRVLSFLAEGTDVIVSTDHDYVTDYGPAVQALGAQGLIASVVGEEVSTFDWGHFNGFPFTLDRADRLGGAIDWAGGDGPALTPAQLMARMRAKPGPADRIVQVNHARGTIGHFTAIGLDTGSGTTAADPAVHRMPVDGVAPGDTGLFSRDFDALEILNGYGVGDLRARTRDWFAFLQRGLTVTGTATSDTHTAFTLGVGNPRSWLQVGADTAQAFQVGTFVDALRQGRVVGSNGPFVQAWATAGADTAAIGETLSVAPGTKVTLRIEVQMPTWMAIDRIEVHTNVEGTDSRPFEESSTLPAPDHTIPVDMGAEISVPGTYVGAPGDTPHRRWLVEREVEVSPVADAWYVVMVFGSQSAFPVILEREVGAAGFTNPIYVDVDGDGRYTPPRAFE